MGSKNANPLTYLFVQDSKSTEALSFRGLEPARDESLTLHSFIRSEDRPFPIFLHIPLSEIRDLMLVQIEPHLFNLTHREVPNEQGYRVTIHSVVGPGQEDETLFGEFTDKDRRSYSYVMITDPEPIIVGTVGAAICLLKIGLERLVARCAKECREACKDRVKKCEGHSTFGVSFDGGFSIGCNYKCKAECF